MHASCRHKERTGPGPDFIDLPAKAVATLESGDGWVDNCSVGMSLHKLQPGFKTSKHGHKKLRALIQACGPEVETRTTSCTVLLGKGAWQPR